MVAVAAGKREKSLRELVNPTPRQQDFLNAVGRCLYVLYGGAAGGGKSYILRWALIGLLMFWAKTLSIRGIRVGLFCEDYPALRDRHLSKIRYEFPKWLGVYKETTHDFELDRRWGSGVLSFRNLDDPSKYLSSEFAAIGVDELSRNPEDTFHRLRMRLRWPGIDRPVFLGATNPGGIGHAYVKKLWIDRDFPPELAALADEFVFIQAKAEDNPHLSPSYIATLASLPAALRRAYLDGDWDVFEGQAFSEWRRESHVIEPFEIPATWHRIRAVDYGYAAPWCVLWLAQNPSTREVIVYRELYANELTDKEQADGIKRNTRDDERIRDTVADPSMWNRRGDTGVSPAQQYGYEGVTLSKASNERIAGKMRVHEFLKVADNGTPHVRVFSSCRNLIRTLPGLVYDKKVVEDVDTDGEDHAYDALRYGLMSLARPFATVSAGIPTSLASSDSPAPRARDHWRSPGVDPFAHRRAS